MIQNSTIFGNGGSSGAKYAKVDLSSSDLNIGSFLVAVSKATINSKAGFTPSIVQIFSKVKRDTTYWADICTYYPGLSENSKYIIQTAQSPNSFPSYPTGVAPSSIPSYTTGATASDYVVFPSGSFGATVTIQECYAECYLAE